jgi:hypothetical protein
MLVDPCGKRRERDADAALRLDERGDLRERVAEIVERDGVEDDAQAKAVRQRRGHGSRTAASWRGHVFGKNQRHRNWNVRDKVWPGVEKEGSWSSGYDAETHSPAGATAGGPRGSDASDDGAKEIVP